MDFNKTYCLKDIAQIIDCQYFGNESIDILGLNEIHSVREGDITFVDHPKYYNKALNSEASVIIINQKVEIPEGKAIILSEDPFADYNKIILHFRTFEASSSQIHPEAKIDASTIIQPNCFIGKNVTIGKNCIIHSNVSIYDHCIIGDNVVIHSNSVIGADAYYFQKKDGRYRKMLSCGKVILENDVEIGALCSIDKGVSADTIIGEGTKMDNHVQIGHDTVIRKHCLIGSQCAIAGVSTIEDDVILWAKVGINKDLTIGQGAVILATSNVDKSLEGNKVYFGSPVLEAREKWKEIAKLNRIIREA